ncbi:MAG: penicillin acylase family protein [Microbacteriaceae bacterium]
MGTDAPRISRHRGLKILGGFVVVVVVLALTATGIGIWTVHRSFPQTSGTLTIPGLQHQVIVRRDSAGIPQLSAGTAHDLFLAQGYVQAQDRFWEMDFRRHVTSGRLAELFGASQIDTDTFIRTLGWRAVAEKEVKLLDPVALAYYQAYADGVNAYLATHHGADLSLEYAVIGLQHPGYQPEPWTPADSVAWLKAMAWDLRSNLVDEVDRALLAKKLTPAQIAELHPPYPYVDHPTITDQGGGNDLATAAAATAVTTSAQGPDATGPVVSTAEAGPLADFKHTLEAIPQLLGPAGSDIGSNSWVVDGAHSATGKPILANDPHLGAVLPSVWYQMGLHCTTVSKACPFDVAGFTFSGLPGVVIGHNNRIAWGFTNLAPDVADLYLEKVTGNSYEYDGVQKPLTTHSETITVAGGDPVRITIRSSEHGPIVTGLTKDFAAIGTKHPATDDIPAGNYQLSLQWTALTPGHTAGAIFALDLAQNWPEFRASAANFDVPSQNLIYADVDGNIGYQAPGQVPIRKTGDGTVPVPGWSSQYGWSGYLGFDQLPSAYNPAKGFIVTANNAAVGPDSPVQVTKDWDYGYRANQITGRLQSLLDAGTKITVDTMAAIQADSYDANAATLVPYLTSLGVKGDAAKAIDLLRDWKFTDDANSAAAAYFNIFWKNLLHDAFARKLPASTAPGGGDRWFQVVAQQVRNPDSPWWTDASLGVEGRDQMFAQAASDAYREAVDLMGSDVKNWKWGSIHGLELTNASLGESGVAPIEWLFNRGPYPVGGSSSVVKANGWDAAAGYQVEHVPSMRQVISLADFDSSTWVNLTGASGHAFDPNYVDQAALWQADKTRPWPFSKSAVRDATADTLTLKPSGH